MNSEQTASLSRGDADSPAPPVRIVHLGLGSFFRAHQAWYTDQAPDARAWGIAAFTGRRADMAEMLTPQDGLYTLVTRGPQTDRFHVVRSLSAVHSAAEHAAWLDYLRSAELALVTMTVTEAGYRRASNGSLDRTDEAVARDVASLRADLASPVSTVPARLLAGLLARAAAHRAPVAVVPCDNLPDNGAAVARVVSEMAELVRPGLSADVGRAASFVTTMVDRITPMTTESDVETVRGATGVADAAPVVTEPFSEWVVSGDFPAGRPRWEDAGVTFVDDVAPFEQRKLWLLNGAHSLLAYGGGLRGHTTVSEAAADDVCRQWVHEWWDEAARHLALPDTDIAAYRAALLERWANPRIRHLLSQIATDGSQKLPVRAVPVLRKEQAAGRAPTAATRMLATWVCHLRGMGVAVTDTRADEAQAAAAGPLAIAVPRALAILDGELADDTQVIGMVTEHVEAMTG